MKYIVSSANKQCLHKIVEEELRKLGINVNLQESISSVQNDSSQNKEILSAFGYSLDCQSKVSYFRQGRIHEEESSETDSVDIPLILFKLCEFLRNDRLTTVGLFRVPGGKSRIKILKSELDHGKNIEKGYAYTHDIASLLKMFLRQLPEPVIPSWSHDVLVKCTKLSSACDKAKALLLVTSVLPRAHVHLLVYLFDFLSEVISYSDQNKMNLENICSMMTPNLIKPNQSSTCSIDNITEAEKQMGLHNEVVEQLCLLHRDIGCLPEDIYNRVCKGSTCLHLLEDSSLCSENTALILDTEASRQKRKSLTERVGTTLSKLMKNNAKTPSKQEQEQFVKMSIHTPKIRPKRLSDIHDANTQTSKRRSFQGYVLPPKELPPGARVTPMIVVTPPEQEVNSRFETKANCNFTGNDTTTFTPCGVASVTTADHSMPKSAKKLFRKFIKVKRNDSGDTSCFCKRQQEAADPPSQKKHSGRLRRSLRRNHKRKSINQDSNNPDNNVIISLPMGNPEHSQMTNTEQMALASSSPSFCTNKNDKPSFFKRLSSPRPSPKISRRRSSGKKGVVSLLTSPFSHNKRKLRKSQREERCVSNFNETDARPSNDEGCRYDSSHSRSTDTLDSLASNQTAETLDVLEDPDQSPTDSPPNESKDFCTTELKQRTNGFDNTAFDNDKMLVTSKYLAASPDASTSGDSEPFSVNLNDSIFDLSFGTLIRMNDPSYRKNENAQGKLDESLVNLFQDNWDSLASVDDEVALSRLPHNRSTVNCNASKLKLRDTEEIAARSPLKRTRKSSTDEQMSPDDCSENHRDTESETTDSNLSVEDTYKKFDEIDSLSLCNAAAACAVPEIQEVTVDIASCGPVGKVDRDDNINSINHNVKSLPVHKSEGCPKLSTFKKPTRTDRPIRVNFRTSVLHPSPAKAPRISRSIQKSYSCKGRPLSEKPSYRSARSKVKTEISSLARSKSVQVTTSSSGSQKKSEALISKSPVHQREMKDACRVGNHSALSKDDHSQNGNEVKHPEGNNEDTKPKKTVCHKNPSVARVRIVSTPSPSITRSRVISRRSGGQLPRMRNLSRAAQSPSKSRTRKQNNTPTKRFSSSRKSKYTPTKKSRKTPTRSGAKLDSGSAPARCLTTESASHTHQTLKNDRGPPGSPPCVDVILGQTEDKCCSTDIVHAADNYKEKEFQQLCDDKESVDIATCENFEFPVSPAKLQDYSLSPAEFSAAETNYKNEYSDRNLEHSNPDDFITQEKDMIENDCRKKSLTSSGGKWSSDSSLYNLVKCLNLDVKESEKCDESKSLCGGDQRSSKWERRQLPRGFQAGHVSECINRFNALAKPHTSLKSQAVTADPLKSSQDSEQPKNSSATVFCCTDDNEKKPSLRTPKIKQPLITVGKGKTMAELRKIKDLNAKQGELDKTNTETEDSDNSGGMEKISRPVKPIAVRDGEKSSSKHKNKLPTPNNALKPSKASVVHSSPRPRRSPLVIRNINTCQDILDYSPVKRATPQAPRSRKPILPMSADRNQPYWSRHNRTLSESDIDLIVGDRGVENQKPTESKRCIASGNLQRQNPKLCRSMELLEAEGSYSAKPYQSFTIKDLSRTISNPITVIDSKSVKHTLV